MVIIFAPAVRRRCMVRHLPLRTPLLEAPFAPAFYWFGAVHAAHCVVAPQHEVVWEYFTSMLLPLQGCDERAHVGPLRMSRRMASIPARRRRLDAAFCDGASPGHARSEMQRSGPWASVRALRQGAAETGARCAEERRRRQGEGAGGGGRRRRRVKDRAASRSDGGRRRRVKDRAASRSGGGDRVGRSGGGRRRRRVAEETG